MANKRLLAIVTALMLATGGGQMALGAYTFSQLEIIEQFILNGEWDLLKAFIDENPELLQGNDALANELRSFVIAVEESGTISTITTPPVVPDIIVVETVKDSY